MSEVVNQRRKKPKLQLKENTKKKNILQLCKKPQNQLSRPFKPQTVEQGMIMPRPYITALFETSKFLSAQSIQF